MSEGEKEKYKAKYNASYNPTIFEFETMNLMMRNAFNKKMQFEEYYYEDPALGLKALASLYDYYRFTRRLMGTVDIRKKPIDEEFRKLKVEMYSFEAHIATQTMNGVIELAVIRHEITKRFWGLHDRYSKLFDLCMEEAQNHGLGFTARREMSSEEKVMGVFDG